MSRPLPPEKKKKVVALRLYPPIIEAIKKQASLQKWIEEAIAYRLSIQGKYPSESGYKP